MNNLRWTLWNRGRPAVTGSDEEWAGHIVGSSGDTTGRFIGRFYASAGKQCALSIYFKDDPSELNITNPRLVIQPTDLFGGAFLGSANDSLLLPTLAEVWVVTALIWGAMLLLRKRRAQSPPGSGAG